MFARAAIALPEIELLSASTIAAICTVDRRAVQLRMQDVEPAQIGPNRTKLWRLDQLPADYQHRITLAKQVKGYARAEDIVDWSKRAESMFRWKIEQHTDHEQKNWPHRKTALLEYYRCVEADMTCERAKERACEVWLALTGTSCTPRTIHNWLEPVEKCGGPEHAPDVAYTSWRRGKRGTHVPNATISYFNTLLTNNARKFTPAYRELLDQLQLWRDTGDPAHAIPGYTTPPPNAKGKDHPFRWTRVYLTARKRRPSPQVMTLARIGDHAADELIAIMRNRRDGTKVGQFIFFDDQEYDEQVNLIGINSKAMRPLGLDALDFTSACLFTQLFVPTVWDDVDKSKQKLKEWHMAWFVCHVLTQYGYRRDADGTWLICESGTAAIDEAFRQRIDLVTGGKVRVKSGHPDGPAAFSGVFSGPGKGNPRVKAPLESWRNRQRNDMANRLMFPAQTGMDRDHAPEELTGRNQYNSWLLKFVQGVPEELRPLFEFPVNEYSTFVERAVAYTERINRDPKHELAQWMECGFTIREWRMRDDPQGKWRSLDEFKNLPEFECLMVEQALRANPENVQVRFLSRREVFEGGRQELVRVPEWDIPRLMGPKFAVVRKVEADGTFIRFRDEDLDPYGREFVFLARIEDQAGHQANLTAGTSYQTYLNPLAPDRLIICQLNGGFLGTCPAIDGAKWNEHEKRRELLRMQQQLGKEARADLEILGMDRTRELHRQKMTNAGAAAPGKNARAEQQKAAVKTAASEFFE